MIKYHQKKHWIRLGFRVINLYLTQKEKTSEFVKIGYNNAAIDYDEAWTNHMRDFTDDMISRLNVSKTFTCLDLFCGTGYVTGKLSELTDGKIIGVDSSPGMLKIARKKYGDRGKFIESDVLEFLKKQPSNSYDIITCAWAICYSKPNKVIKEISRVLKPSRYVAIIDNKLSSVWELFIAILYTVAENPEMIRHVMKINLLANKKSLTFRMRLNGLKVTDSWDGEKTYYASSGRDVIDRFLSTGVFAGGKYFIYEEYHSQFLKRFKKIVEEQYMQKDGIPIIHRYIAAIGKKK